MTSVAVVKFQLRRDTSVNWEKSTVLLRDGEPGFDVDRNILKIGPVGGALWKNIPETNTFYPGRNTRSTNQISVQAGLYPLTSNHQTMLSAIITPGASTSTFVIGSSTKTKTIEVPNMFPSEIWRVDCQCSCVFSADATNHATLSIGNTTSNIRIWDYSSANASNSKSVTLAQSHTNSSGATTLPTANIVYTVKNAGFAVINLTDVPRDQIPTKIMASYGGTSSDPGSVIFYIESLLFTRIA